MRRRRSHREDGSRSSASSSLWSSPPPRSTDELSMGSMSGLTAYLDNLVESQKVPGIQYAVVDADGVMFDYASGCRDFENPHERVASDTVFLSSSCTKVITSAAILKLAEAKQLKLDDSLSTYYDSHPYGDRVTIRQLLNQSSGVPNPPPLKWFHTEHDHLTYDESQQLRQTLQAHPKLDFEPGTKYAYSNLSYWLLGKVIEKASGMSYRDYLHTHIFAPLDITPSEMDCQLGNPDKYAKGHIERFSLVTFILWLLTDAKIWDNSTAWWGRFQRLYMDGPAYGGVFGTALGYAKFLQDILRQRPKMFSKKDTKLLFFSIEHDSAGNLLPTTLGWHRGRLQVTTGGGEEQQRGRSSSSTEHFFGKPGGGPGYHSCVRVYPRLGIATVFLCNKMEVDEGPINAMADNLDRRCLESLSD